MAVSKVLWRVFRWVGWLLGLSLLALTVWLFSLEPSNDREWQSDAAVLASATIEGDMVTVHNMRNFDYRSEFDYTPAYYDKRYDLGQIEGGDRVAVYWRGPHIAHVFLSFAFSDGEHVAISIESRKEKGEAYSTFKGFFRQYELNYVVGDERDLIRLRSNYRRDPPEDVYVYRTAMPKEGAKRLFLEYMREINALKQDHRAMFTQLLEPWACSHESRVHIEGHPDFKAQPTRRATPTSCSRSSMQPTTKASMKRP